MIGSPCPEHEKAPPDTVRAGLLAGTGDAIARAPGDPVMDQSMTCTMRRVLGSTSTGVSLTTV